MHAIDELPDERGDERPVCPPLCRGQKGVCLRPEAQAVTFDLSGNFHARPRKRTRRSFDHSDSGQGLRSGKAAANQIVSRSPNALACTAAYGACQAAKRSIAIAGGSAFEPRDHSRRPELRVADKIELCRQIGDLRAVGARCLLKAHRSGKVGAAAIGRDAPEGCCLVYPAPFDGHARRGGGGNAGEAVRQIPGALDFQTDCAELTVDPAPSIADDQIEIGQPGWSIALAVNDPVEGAEAHLPVCKSTVYARLDELD